MNRRVADIRKDGMNSVRGVLDRLSRLPLARGHRRIVIQRENHLFVGIDDVDHHAIIFGEPGVWQRQRTCR